MILQISTQPSANDRPITRSLGACASRNERAGLSASQGAEILSGVLNSVSTCVLCSTYGCGPLQILADMVATVIAQLHTTIISDYNIFKRETLYGVSSDYNILHENMNVD